MNTSLSKTKELGQYYTLYNPFEYTVVKNWLTKNIKINHTFLEPFAGSNNLVKMIKELEFKNKWGCYDIEPGSSDVKQRDTIADFPTGYNVCITNPPYLAKNSAQRLNLNFPNTIYDDLYKLCLEKCLNNCEYVIAIIPESFINCKELKDRLDIVISLTKPMFEYTDCPVCLALFNNKNTKDFSVYKEDIYLGDYNAMNPVGSILSLGFKFNDAKGALGLWAIDNTQQASIKFCKGDEITNSGKNIIKVSSRSYTRISMPLLKYIDLDLLIVDLNKELTLFRQNTNDIYLTSFKGLRKDGLYRRRMDWKIAKYLIGKVLTQ